MTDFSLPVFHTIVRKGYALFSCMNRSFSLFHCAPFNRPVLLTKLDPWRRRALSTRSAENQGQMRHDERDVDPHISPDKCQTRRLRLSLKGPLKPLGVECGLCGIDQSCSHRKNPGDWNREVNAGRAGARCTLCLKRDAAPIGASQFLAEMEKNRSSSNRTILSFFFHSPDRRQSADGSAR